MEQIAVFTAGVVTGAGRGKRLGTPTLNLRLQDVPENLKEGIYACFVLMDGKKEQAAMHYGPRPVFHDSVSCEIYLLDQVIDVPPVTLTVEVKAYLREVRDFPSPEALKEQIAQDIQDTRAMLQNA